VFWQIPLSLDGRGQGEGGEILYLDFGGVCAKTPYWRDNVDSLYFILMVLVISGAVAGFLAGLLGIGGGIVMVPVLYVAFGIIGVPEVWHMHLTVATSLGIVIPTAFFSARAHRKKAAILGKIIRAWMPFVIAGTVFGVVLAGYLKSSDMVLIFAVIAFLMGIKLILPLEDKVVSKEFPSKPLGGLLATIIGAASSLMGIGGATLSVPTMTLFNVPIHKAVGTASLLGLIIAIPATIGYIWQGVGASGLPPYSLGFVNLVGVAVVAPVSSLMAPIGVKTAHLLSHRVLSIIFGLFLIIAAGRMAFPLIGA